MRPFDEVHGVAVPLMMADIDTDQMISHKFLITRSKEGLGKGLFHHWRVQGGEPVADFPLNRPEYRDATILITGPNFACGSSREHAVWSMIDYGFRVVIAPSFGVHFRRNAIKNGLLPVQFDLDTVNAIARWVEESRDACRIRVSLPEQTVTPEGGTSLRFDIEEEVKTALLEGLDDIGLTLRHAAAISAFQKRDAARRPWVYLGNAN